MQTNSQVRTVSMEPGWNVPALKIPFFSGRKGILKTQSGLQIAYLSGVEKSDAPEVYCYVALKNDSFDRNHLFK